MIPLFSLGFAVPSSFHHIWVHMHLTEIEIEIESGNTLSLPSKTEEVDVGIYCSVCPLHYKRVLKYT